MAVHYVGGKAQPYGCKYNIAESDYAHETESGRGSGFRIKVQELSNRKGIKVHVSRTRHYDNGTEHAQMCTEGGALIRAKQL